MKVLLTAVCKVFFLVSLLGPAAAEHPRSTATADPENIWTRTKQPT